MKQGLLKVKNAVCTFFGMDSISSLIVLMTTECHSLNYLRLAKLCKIYVDVEYGREHHIYV